MKSNREEGRILARVARLTVLVDPEEVIVGSFTWRAKFRMDIILRHADLHALPELSVRYSQVIPFFPGNISPEAEKR
ncbi:MAG: hypothetical protein AAF394_19105 [Planctomycetota bacterium]